MKAKLIIYLCTFSFFLSAQKYDYVWQLGYRYRPNINFELNFNSKKAVIKTNTRNFDLYLTTTTMSNPKTGDMLFATNGCNIYDKSFNIMENGNDINLSLIADIVCNRFGNVIVQGALALPSPDDKNDSIFYLFNQSFNRIILGNQKLIVDKFYYSIIDIKKNNGLGSVISKNQILLNDTLDGGIVSVKHADGKSWWILVREYNTTNFYTYKLSSNGIDSPFTQSIGLTYDYPCNGGIQSCFSPDGKKLAAYSNCDGLFIYDFNRQTGKLSNFMHDTLYELPGYWHGGCVISPNSQFLYALTGNTIYQYDLKASDIKSSKVLVAQYDGYKDPFDVYLTFGQLAPDCRIYVFSINGIQSFGYIKYPDRKGIDCQVVQHGISLPKDDLAVAGSVPNFPNYRLGVTPTYPCDSTIEFKVATSEVQLPPVQYILYPNPTNTTLNIDYEPTGGETKADVTITDLLGKIVFTQKLDLYSTPLSMDVQNLPAGMYHCIFKVKDKLPTAQRFVIIR